MVRMKDRIPLWNAVSGRLGRHRCVKIATRQSHQIVFSQSSPHGTHKLHIPNRRPALFGFVRDKKSFQKIPARSRTPFAETFLP
jgi:hypothetical protein